MNGSEPTFIRPFEEIGEQSRRPAFDPIDAQDAAGEAAERAPLLDKRRAPFEGALDHRELGEAER
jgi:hypothetical protein